MERRGDYGLAWRRTIEQIAYNSRRPLRVHRGDFVRASSLVNSSPLKYFTGVKNIPVRFWISVSAALLLTGCVSPRNSILQVGAMDALLAGAYDGQASCWILEHKNLLGLGTFDRLDGEMIVLDGRIYQVRADGHVYSPPSTETTPFAAVIDFKPNQTFKLNGGMTYRQFEEQLDAKLGDTNLVYAFRLTGSFHQMKTRSVPAQTKPYIPLIEVTRKQSVFDLGQCSGTLVGFRMPGFVKGVNVPGYHAHFLTEDRKAGGHVLDFNLDGGTVDIAVCSRIDLRLPENSTSLKGIDLSRDRSQELEKAEK
jgi:acetolactate decarboxylase